MAKLKLGATPKNFKPFPVKFILPDGVEDQIVCTFKYMTRSQFAAFLNTLFAESGESKPETSEKVDFEALFAKGGEKTVAHLAKILDAWDLDDDISAKNLAALHDQIPAAAAAMTSSFSAAATEGRLGN